MIAFGPRLGQRGQNWRAVRSDARIRSAASVDSSLVPYSVHAGTVVTQDEPGVWLQLGEEGESAWIRDPGRASRIVERGMERVVDVTQHHCMRGSGQRQRHRHSVGWIPAVAGTRACFGARGRGSICLCLPPKVR